MNQNRWFFIAMICIGIMGMAGHAVYGETAGPVVVDIQELTTHGDQYQGKLVRTVGYVRLDAGVQGIFASEEKAQKAENGLWLHLSEEIMKNREAFDKQFCLVEGVMNAKSRGPMSRMKGSIDKVMRIETLG